MGDHSRLPKAFTGVSALAPLTVGYVARELSFGAAFLVLSGAFLLAAVLALALPETKGKPLD